MAGIEQPFLHSSDQHEPRANKLDDAWHGCFRECHNLIHQHACDEYRAVLSRGLSLKFPRLFFDATLDLTRLQTRFQSLSGLHMPRIADDHAGRRVRRDGVTARQHLFRA